MNARTRSDILAASSGRTPAQAARIMLIAATSDEQRVTLEALEFAIEAARHPDRGARAVVCSECGKELDHR